MLGMNSPEIIMHIQQAGTRDRLDSVSKMCLRFLTMNSSQERYSAEEKTMSPLPSHYGYANIKTPKTPCIMRPRTWQRNAILLILVYFLLQLHRTIFAGLSAALQQRSSCYADYANRPHIWVGPGLDAIRLACLLNEPIRREMTGLLDWDRIFSVVPSEQ